MEIELPFVKVMSRLCQQKKRDFHPVQGHFSSLQNATTDLWKELSAEDQ